MTTHSRLFAFGLAALLVLAGIACAIAFSGTLGQVLALVLISLGFVLATALVFYEVGLSEDRERERESARREATRQPPTRRPRPRLQRARGRPRRLS